MKMSFASQTTMDLSGSILRPRTLVIQNEVTFRSIILEIEVLLGQENDLSYKIEALCPISLNSVSIYHPGLNKFVPLPQLQSSPATIVPWIFFEPQVVMLRYKSLSMNAHSTQSEKGKDSKEPNKLVVKERSKERTIGECIDLVRKWRKLHLRGVSCDKPKFSLVEAAKRVGVSKKSLDDYYYQLRLGEFYNFNFAANLLEKIGILRAYVREFKPERESKNKNIRHPKLLKVIREAEPASTAAIAANPQGSLCGSETTMVPDLLLPYEDDFFKNFEFLMDDPLDPFLKFEWSFRKFREIDFDNDLVHF